MPAKKKRTENPIRISERQFQHQIEILLDLNEWWWKHDLKGRLPNGKIATLLRGKSGFPDIIAVRDGELIFIEVKSAIGRTSPNQVRWIEELRLAGCEVYVWRPRDIDEVKRRLSIKRRKK